MLGQFADRLDKAKPMNNKLCSFINLTEELKTTLIKTYKITNEIINNVLRFNFV